MPQIQPSSMCHSKCQDVLDINANESANSFSYRCLFLSDITLETNAMKSDLTQEIKVNNTTTIKLKLDTAAQANIIPTNILCTFYTNPLQMTNIQLNSYSQYIIQPKAQVKLKCHPRKRCMFRFGIAEKTGAKFCKPITRLSTDAKAFGSYQVNILLN